MAHLPSALQIEFSGICIWYYAVHQRFEIPSQQHAIWRLTWSQSKAFFNEGVEKVKNVYACIQCPLFIEFRVCQFFCSSCNVFR